MKIDEKIIDRVEIVGNVREYVNDSCKVTAILLQDNNKTMKIFIEDKNDKRPS